MTEQIFWVILSSASPVFELRAGIPLGVLVFHLNPFWVFIVAVLSNFLIVPFLILFLKHFSEFFMHRFYFFNRLLNYIFLKTRDHHAHKFEKWEHWALLGLVAIPLPFTGAWTGALAAFLFDIPMKRALAVIFLGLVIAGIIVSGLTVFGNGALIGVK
ncbi:MAG: ligand-binding protein SH3 [Candidatus Tagabacteria bacterium CG09_land_8_20_14_0_10_41_14]|uniref:Ligand-binding protein SH3 n=2 Tax=Candidatus Tagaibacteriota TaxID=1817918 RepID=A0A2H0WLC7_9BACT|nr:MAG: ligand-binding protein SH3 [Candidatus Tagabacteria bacterium CG09_land_8_20_14_0_10_41_14]PJE73120.1 MAG: ligand-binding protein SH3 [Candidatus Tagabacteria bacterium CG10_big_fil_rev_8_21_14_0_10_40_13]